ncbi:little elongation complex subunit 1 isoform X2 [Rhineura floridana]|nr:little elongation complex subunit 1 isoform X2 [Rhineura floridana]
MQNPQKIRKPRNERPSGGSSPESCTTHTSLASSQIKLDNRPAGHGAPVESRAMETTGAYNSSSAFYEDRSLEVTVEADLGASDMDDFHKEQEELGENLRDILQWIRPLPPLLSPIQFSPSATPDTLFGNLTDSSDDEMNQDAQILENILEKCDLDEPIAENLYEDHSAESQNKCISFSLNNPERLSKLTDEKSVLYSDLVSETSIYLNERDAKSKNEEKYVEENNDVIQMHTAIEVAAYSAENINEKLVNMMETEDKILIPDLMSLSVNLQEKTAESMPMQEVVGNSVEHVLGESSNLTKEEEKEELTGTIEDDWPQVPKGDDQQQTNMLVAPEKCKDRSSDMKGGVENGSSGIHTKFNLEETEHLGEEHTEHVTTYKQNATTEGFGTGRNSEPSMEEKINFRNHNFLSEVEHSSELVQPEGSVVPLKQAMEKDVPVSDVSIKSQCVEEDHGNEERCDKQNEPELNGKNELGDLDVLRSQSHITVVDDECKKSSYCTDETIQSEEECNIAPSVHTKHGEDYQLKAENENVVDKIADSITEKSKLIDIKKECLQVEQFLDQKDSIKTLQEEPDYESDPMLPAQASIIKEYSSGGPLETNHKVLESENLIGNASELGHADFEYECKSKILSISSSFQYTETVMEEECLTSKRLVEEDSELLKITETGTTQCIIVEGSEETSEFGIECDRNGTSDLIPKNLHCGINNAPSQEKANRNEESNSSILRKYAVEGTEMNYKCSVTNEVVSKQNTNEDAAQSMCCIDALQAENADTEITSSVTVTGGSKSTSEPIDVTACNLEINDELFSRKGQSSEGAANILSSLSVYIVPSPPTGEDADHIEHRNSGEDLKAKEANITDSEENIHKPLTCCSPDNNKDQMEIERTRLSTISDPQISCNGEISKALTPVASSLNSDNAVDIFKANKGAVLSDEELLILPEKLGSPSTNFVVEHILNDTAAKETDEISSHGIRFGGLKLSENAVVIGKSSTSDSSDEEVFLLRKVNCTRPQQRREGCREDMGAIRNSHVGAPSNMTLFGSDGHEVSHVTEEASQKDRHIAVQDTDSYAAEVTERMWEHSYAAGWTRNNENASLKLESSVAIEISKEGQAEQSISAVASLTSQSLMYNRKSVSRKSFASGLQVNSEIVASYSEYNGASLKTSEIQSDIYKEKSSAEQERDFATSECNSNMMQNQLTSVHVDCDANTSHNKECHIKNEGKTCAAQTSWNSIPPVSESSSNSNSKQQKIVPEKLASLPTLASCTKNGVEQILKPSDSRNVSVQAGLKGGHDRPLHTIPPHKGKRKSQHTLLAETIFANADTSTPTTCSLKTLTKIRQEMGPPLPPLLPPLIATPPRTVRLLSPIMSSSSQSSLPSPLDEIISPSCETPVTSLMSPLSDIPKCKSPTTLTTPSPSDMRISQRALSSPLQFCATTPKHALPVPGRLPPSASGSPALPVHHENSVKILDSMYPELSARARTLSILKGNIQLSRSSSLDGKNIPQPVRQFSGFKAIASMSTAFVKTGSNLKSDPEQPFSNVSDSGKRMLAPVAMPKSAKRPRLDSKSPKPNISKELSTKILDTDVPCPAEETVDLSSGNGTQSTGDCDSELLLALKKTDDPDNSVVTVALEKISKACFDLLPVIRSRVFVGNTSKIPVMTDEEKEVVYELGVAKKYLAEKALQAILKKLKKQKMSLGHNHIQSLCRVYVGICRQLGDLEKARLFCYSLLKEDFPKSDKLTLFTGSTWPEIFSSESVINKAIQLVARQRARGEVLKCLRTYLNLEENPPADIGMMVSSLLLAIQLCPQVEFHLSEQYGEDLKESTWEYVFAIDLLCSHQKWRWTHDNIISKELWPIMDKWVKNRKGNGNVSSPSDIIVATVLRLIGRLGQIGLREGFFFAVENISSVIGIFLQHAKEKDVAWGVQLAAAYALCDLGPSNPPRVLEAIRTWEAVNTNSLPPAATSGIAEVTSLLKCVGRTKGSLSA